MDPEVYAWLTCVGVLPTHKEAMTTSLLIVAATTVFAAPIGKGVLAFAPPSMRLENEIEEVQAVFPPIFDWSSPVTVWVSAWNGSTKRRGIFFRPPSPNSMMSVGSVGRTLATMAPQTTGGKGSASRRSCTDQWQLGPARDGRKWRDSNPAAGASSRAMHGDRRRGRRSRTFGRCRRESLGGRAVSDGAGKERNVAHAAIRHRSGCRAAVRCRDARL